MKQESLVEGVKVCGVVWSVCDCCWLWQGWWKVEVGSRQSEDVDRNSCEVGSVTCGWEALVAGKIETCTCLVACDAGVLVACAGSSHSCGLGTWWPCGELQLACAACQGSLCDVGQVLVQDMVRCQDMGCVEVQVQVFGCWHPLLVPVLCLVVASSFGELLEQ